MANKERVSRAKEFGIRLIVAEEAQGGGIDPASLRTVLSDLGSNALYCEGGPTFARSLLELGQVDYLFRYRSPKLFDDRQMRCPVRAWMDIPFGNRSRKSLAKTA